MTDPAVRAETVQAELARLGEIAAGILDGEEVKAIITDRAMYYIANPDPQFRYLSGDYFDVDHGLFLRTKKLLLRIARLGKVQVDTSVWVPVPGTGAVTVAVQNGVHHRYYRFGQIKLDTPPEMKEVFQSGEVRTLGPDARGWVTALAPVRDSLGEVVAVAELTAPLGGPPPAWS